MGGRHAGGAARTYNAADQVVGWTYDALGRLTSTTQNGTTTQSYNGDGVLVAQTQGSTTTRSTQDLVAPLSQILQRQQGTQRTDYVYGRERLLAQTGTAQTWYGSDALGSVRQTLDATGAPLMALHYDPWGTPQGGATPPTFGFTGELQGTDELTYLRARWYQPTHGRFTSRDPFAGFPTLPYSLHPYQYAYANPVLVTDPSGEVCIPTWVPGIGGWGCEPPKESREGVGGGYFSCPPGEEWIESWKHCVRIVQDADVLGGTVVVLPGGPAAGQALAKTGQACVGAISALFALLAVDKATEGIDVGVQRNEERSPVRVQLQQGKTTYATAPLRDMGGGVTVAQVLAALTTLYVHPAIPKSQRAGAVKAYNDAVTWTSSRPPQGVPGLLKKSFYFEIQRIAKIVGALTSMFCSGII